VLNASGRFLISVASGDRVSEGDIARFQVQLGFRGRAKNARSFVIEFSFPSRDHNRGQTISDEIYAGASHVHQFIDTKDYRHTNRTETGRQEAV
jgi:hypothetical protein